MLSSIILRVIFGVVFLFIVDLLCSYGIKMLVQPKRLVRLRKLLIRIHWAVPLAFIIWILILVLTRGNPAKDYLTYRSYQTFTGALMLVYGPKFIFSLFSLIQLLFNLTKSAKKRKQSSYYSRRSNNEKKSGNILVKIALIFSVALIFIIAKGILINRNNFKINEIELQSERIPKSFDGFKVTLISDAHLGSFYKDNIPNKLSKLIKSTKPNLFLNLGDMVNTDPKETLRYIQAFSSINASHGKYSILGNHDMDDFARTNRFETDSTKLIDLIRFQSHMGLKTLNDEHVFIKNGKDSIALIGVRNWGLPPFYQYGNLSKANYGIDTTIFSILMSHDPSHWKAEVVPKSHIDLTLSGHTHAFQFGVSIFGWQWSPVALLYPEWNGFYKQQDQHLFISKGLGFIGFPGRIGMKPEVVVLTLRAEG